MNFLLDITKDQLNEQIIFTEGALETLFYGLKLFLIGMGAVFAALCLIWFSLYLFKIFLHDIPAKKKAKPVVEEKVEAVTTVTEAVNNDEEIIAAIAAAIAMAESECPNSKFRVVSFRRT